MRQTHTPDLTNSSDVLVHPPRATLCWAHPRSSAMASPGYGPPPGLLCRWATGRPGWASTVELPHASRQVRRRGRGRDQRQQHRAGSQTT